MATLNVAVQMDPLDGIDINADSTFALMLEAASRGHTLYQYQPKDLTFDNGKVTAFASQVTVQRKEGDHFKLQAPAVIDLTDMDVVWLRQDPPFDMAYITTTHVLEHIHPKTLVVNDPASVRNAPEKLFVTHFPDLMPPTMVAHRKEDILDFRARHKDIIVKPLYGNGGAGVFRIAPEDENINALLEMFTEFYREPVIVQAYLPDVRKGDKRIILVDGEVAGAMNRIPPKGETRSNLHVGGKAEASELTKREEEICAAIGPKLKELGLIFVGIDVIGDYMTEVNVTSPIGIRELDRQFDLNIAGLMFDAIERKLG